MAQYQPDTAESHTVVEEGPYTPHEMVIGRSPGLVPTTRDNNINISAATEPDPEQELQWMRSIQEAGPHYPDELA